MPYRCALHTTALPLATLTEHKDSAMQMIYCPNCQKRTGFRRGLGFGTLFMVVITFGLWLLVIPLYPARCMACGLERKEALWTNLYAWWESRTMGQKVVAGLMLASLVTTILVLFPHTQQPAPIIKGPDYDKPVGSHDIETSNKSRNSVRVATQTSGSGRVGLDPTRSVYDVEDITMEIDDNPVRGGLFLSEKVIKIRGTVDRISTANVWTGVTLSLGGFSVSSPLPLLCSLSSTPMVTQLHKGSVVLLSGKYLGRQNGTVAFSPCKLETIEPGHVALVSV
jgi:hypothetical protein